MSQVTRDASLEPFGFDIMQLDQRIQNSDKKMVEGLKTFMQSAHETLTQYFLTHCKNEPNTHWIKPLIQGHATLIDQVLNYVWQQMQWPAGSHSEIGLVAVGGYGRGQLHPHSDIDLLILLNQPITPEIQTPIEQFLTVLWDIKLEVGHSVRTLEECIEAGRSDITVATNLLEARLLTGSTELFASLQQHTGPQTLWQDAAFFQAKLKEQKQRHKKYEHTEYNLEPDLKNSPGGLRDVQVIEWVTRHHFRTHHLQELIEQDFLSSEEIHLLENNQAFLWQIRFAIHIHAKRDDNRLLFGHQQAIASMFGYQDSEVQLAVEMLMKQYYRAALAISEINELTMQLMGEVFLSPEQEQKIQPINERFQIRNHNIEMKSADVFQKTPSALLEVFVLMGQTANINGVSAKTIRALRDNQHLIDEKFRHDPQNTSLFLDLLRSNHRLYTQLLRMKRFGILGRYIPAFEKIIGQMQYDLFHIYTVDAHTLLLIRNLRRFRYPEERSKFPVASQVMQHIPKVELLYLAGLFHDMAKGRGGDHSELGAHDAEQFCLHHRLSKWDAHLVAWLVKNHLLMSITAQKKDLSDPESINTFAKQVGDEVHLDYLYLLTIADICATNPTLWNSWRASLLRQLHTETKRALRRGLENPINKAEWIEETREKALIFLRLTGIQLEQVKPIWDQLGDDYFLKEEAEDIAWHAIAILHHPDNEGPLVLTKEVTSHQFEGGTQIFIYTQDQQNLFANTVTTLQQLSLDIVDARIMTSHSNFSLDTYIVLEQSGQSIGENSTRLSAIREALTKTLSQPQLPIPIVQQPLPRALKHFPIKTEVSISNDMLRHHSVLEIRTLDRPGLLAMVGGIFASFHLRVQSARIATLGECAEDVFFVKTQDNQPLSDPQLCEQIQLRLCQELDPIMTE